MYYVKVKRHECLVCPSVPVVKMKRNFQFPSVATAAAAAKTVALAAAVVSSSSSSKTSSNSSNSSSSSSREPKTICP